MEKITLQLATPGIHGASGIIVTGEMLAEMASTFAGDAPICLGHSQSSEDGLPRCGSVKSLSYNGGVLCGEVVFQDWAQRLYDSNLYPCWSIGGNINAGDGLWHLHHLAMLGAVPPAIDGLKELARVQFSNAGKIEYFNVNNVAANQAPITPPPQDAARPERQSEG